MHLNPFELSKRLSDSPLARRLILGAAWSVAGSVLARLVSIAGTVVVVRLIGQEQFGQFAIIQTTVAMAAVLGGMGLGVTATKYVAELRNRDPTRLARVLATTNRIAILGSLTGAAILALMSDPVAHLLNSPNLATLIAVSAIGIVFSSLDGHNTGVILGFEAIRQSVWALVVATLISVPTTLFLAAYYGLEGAVYGMVFAAIVQFSINRWLVRRLLLKEKLPDIDLKVPIDWLVLRGTSLPALLAGVMVMPAHWICQALLVNTPDGHSQMAVIGIVNQWFQAVIFLPAVAGRIVLPVLTDAIAQHDSSDSRQIVTVGLVVNAVVVLLPVVFISAVSPWIMSFYGDVFQPYWNVLVVTVIAAGLLAVQSHVGNLVVATGRFWLGLTMNCGWAVTYIGLSWVFLQHGALGLSVALLIAYLAHGAWTFSFARVWYKRHARQPLSASLD